MKKRIEKKDWKPALIGLLLAGSFLVGCDAEEPCVSSPGTYQIGFFSFNAAGEKEGRQFNFNEVLAIGSDSSFFVQNHAGISDLRLALNPSADTTTFVFSYENGADTLALSYSRTFNVTSPECGPSVSFSDLNITKHTFDSLNLVTTEIAFNSAGNVLEIFGMSSCPDPSTDLLAAGFFVLEEGGTKQPMAFNFDRVRTAGTNRNIYSRNGSGISRLQLSLNPGIDSTAFLFEYGDGEFTDTLTVSYERYFYVALPECGLDTLFRNLVVTKNTFDGVNLINTELRRGGLELDIEIYNSVACESVATDKLGTGFFTLNESGENEPQLYNFDEIKALESGDVFYTGGQTGIAQIQLALAPASEQTTYLFRNEEEVDTLVVSYEKRPLIYSPECPQEEFYTGLTITRHTFDSVSLRTNKLSLTTEGPDVEIYP
jgi:hypothetical protein